MNPKLKAWVVDTGERTGSTYGAAFLGLWFAPVAAAIANGGDSVGALRGIAHTSVAVKAAVAAAPAAVVVIKSAFAALRSGTVSPASLAPAQQPGQAEQDAPPSDPTAEIMPEDIPASVHDRLALLPAPTGRKGGLLPSPRDDRDYQAKLPAAAKIPTSTNYGAGITFGMLLNDRIGDCYPAALLHALQVLSGGVYTPSDADVLHVYEQVTGYDPTRTDSNGNNPTDQGTYGRQLFAWAKQHGLITSYAAVPADRQSIRAAIAAHKAVLCEWALPVGAEREGDVWTMPRTGRAAGSWGGHATVEVGYTPTRNRNVTWGEEGTVTPAFEDSYLQAAWVVAAPATIPAIR